MNNAKKQLTAPDKVNDLDAVTIVDDRFGPERATDHFAIDLDSYTLKRQIEVV